MENPGNITFSTEDDIKYFLENYLEPVLFNGFLNEWKILKWTLTDWADKLGSMKLNFRKNNFAYSEEPQWERTCETIIMTMSEFVQYQSNNENSWVYFDYKYMSEWFETQEEILNDINWKLFGYPDKTGKDSTIWIGSKGAHTPCHSDTYGCNLIAQIYGRKQWIVFPPEEDLKPSRVPYEESSIYSKLNFFAPDVKKFKGIHNARVITLNPGDVLFLPPKWWHYVENLDTSISVNIWMPLPDDNKMRVEEAVVQMLISQFVKQLTTDEKNLIINSNQDDILQTTITNSVTLLENVIQVYKAETFTEKGNKTKLKSVYDTLLAKGIIQEIDKCSDFEFENLLKGKQKFSASSSIPKQKSENIRTLENVINAMCHPYIVSRVVNKLLNEK